MRACRRDDHEYEDDSEDDDGDDEEDEHEDDSVMLRLSASHRGALP